MSGAADQAAGSPGASGAPPPAEALEQPDGSFVQELEDGSSLRWTVRPDGTWRRPEHRRAGWIGELERKPYTPNPLRSGAGTASAAMTAATSSSDNGLPNKNHNGNSVAAEKHELQRGWSLWVGPRSGEDGATWSERHTCVYEFDTVEDFWCMYHHSNPPSKLENADYLLLKKEAASWYGESAFEKGGRWVVKLNEVKATLSDDLWLRAIMALIGESFEDCGGEDVVYGVAVSVQQGSCKVELWLSEPADEEQVLTIGRFYHAVVADTPGVWEKAAQVMTFEDFTKRKVVVQLVGPKAAKSTAGIFQ